MTPNKQRPPSNDEQQESPFVDSNEHEDIVFEEQEKFEKKVNDYFDNLNQPQ